MEFEPLLIKLEFIIYLPKLKVLLLGLEKSVMLVYQLENGAINLLVECNVA